MRVHSARMEINYVSKFIFIPVQMKYVIAFKRVINFSVPVGFVIVLHSKTFYNNILLIRIIIILCKLDTFK